jgi:hypothetical protein
MKMLRRTIRNKKTCIDKFDEQHAIIKTANNDSIGKKESDRAAYAITHGVVGLSAPKAVELKKRASE